MCCPVFGAGPAAMYIHPVSMGFCSPLKTSDSARAYINLPTGCFNPPLSRWNVALSPRRSSDGRSGSKICARPRSNLTAVMDTLHQTTQCSRTQTSSSPNWIQMSQVSGSSIYTLCIFTTGRMIRMLASSARAKENVGPNLLWLF